MTEEPAEPEDPDQASGPGRWSPGSVCRASGSSVRRCSHSQGHGARSGLGLVEGILVTKLSHLVKAMKIKSLEEIYLSSLAIK